MKKILLLAALAVAGLASCQKTETVKFDERTPIEFDVYMGMAPITRATVMDNNFIKTTSIGLYAAEHTNDFADDATWSATPFENVKLYNDGAGWIYDGIQDWKESTKTSFFAYAPYTDLTPAPTANITAVTTGTGYPVIDFTVAANATDQVDMVVSNKTESQNKTKPADHSNAPVNLVFTHTLAKIGFEAKTVNAIGNITIKEIEIGGTEEAAKFYTKAKYDMANTWKEHDSALTTYTLNQNTGLISTAVPRSNDFTKLNTEEGYLMIIPKDFATSATAIPVKVTFTELDETEEHVISGNIAATNFLENHQYTIQFTLDCILNHIMFNVLVNPWEDGGTIPVGVK